MLKLLGAWMVDRPAAPVSASAEAMSDRNASPPAGHRWRRSHPWQEGQGAGAVTLQGCFCHPAEPLAPRGNQRGKQSLVTPGAAATRAWVYWSWMGSGATSLRHEQQRWPLHPLHRRSSATGSRLDAGRPHWRGQGSSQKQVAPPLTSPTPGPWAHRTRSSRSRARPCSRTSGVVCTGRWQTRAGHSSRRRGGLPPNSARQRCARDLHQRRSRYSVASRLSPTVSGIRNRHIVKTTSEIIRCFKKPVPSMTSAADDPGDYLPRGSWMRIDQIQPAHLRKR